MSQHKEFAAQLLSWYDRSQRSLPWRRDLPDPYATWVSEIMLQQTTVAAVIPFFHRWMARFPTVQSLADAPIDDVLQHWAGLGYYARARNLHRGAKAVVEQHGGRVPSDRAQLLALPGIGRYTVGAILSIAFHQDEPILDANVVRVLSRIHGVLGDPKTSAVQATLWRLAEESIPSGQASRFNQAMMELGALVCTPVDPRCPACPVSSLCRAFASGDPTRYPQAQPSKKWLQIEDVSVAICTGDGLVLLTQRLPDAALWGGLWELPRATRQSDETYEQCARRAACETLGLTLASPIPFGSLKHVVANRKVTLSGYRAPLPAAESPTALGCARFVWADLDDLSGFAIPSPQVRLLAMLAREIQQGRLAL